MMLFINTTDFDSVKFALINSEQVKEFSKQLAFNQNYQTLHWLEKFLTKQKTNIKQVKKIVVCSGPGSFTGIRVGISLATAIGFALSIPVVTIPKKEVPDHLQDLLKTKTTTTTKKLRLNYGQKPKITKSKNKRVSN